jgi:hypothetical protein
MRAWVSAVTVAVVVVTLGSCGGSDDSRAAPTTSASASTTVVATTGAPTTAAPSIAPEATVALAPATVAPPTTAGTPATDLVDGKVYWGYLAAFKAGPSPAFTIDVADVYFGQQAIAEATKDHAQATIDPDVDPVMYVRNNNQKTRTFTVKPNVEAVTNGCDYGDGTKNNDCHLAKKVKLADLPVIDGESAGALVIFVLDGGQIARIEQPYFP